MKQPLLSINTIPNDTTNRYGTPQGCLLSTNASWVNTPLSASGKLSKLRVSVASPPGAGKSLTFTLIYNGNPTALEVVISGSETTGSDETHEIDVVAGVKAYIQIVPSGTPTVSRTSFSMVFESSTIKESMVMGMGIGLGNTVTRWVSFFGGSTASTTEIYTESLVSTPGTLRNLRVALTGPPGAGNSYSFTVRKNGADTGLTVTISDSDTDGSDLSNSVTVVAGDRITLKMVPTSTPTAQQANYSLKFVADTDGESIMGGGMYGVDLDTVNVDYTTILAPFIPINGEANAYHVCDEFTLKNLYILLEGAPGAGKSYRARLRVDTVDTDLTVLIADTDVSGNDTTHEIAVSAGEKVSISYTPSLGPAAQTASWGITAFSPPAASVGGINSALMELLS